MTKPLSEQVAELRADVEALKAGKHKKRGKKKVKDSTGRSVRLGVWVALATVVANWLAPHLPHIVDHQRQVLIGVLAAGFAKVYAAAEERYGFSVLRQTPPTTAPVVDA